jgi:HAD superfamily phosphatase (TIGR01681 family)
MPYSQYSCLAKIQQQSMLFSSSLSRLELQKLLCEEEVLSFRLQIHRNQSFEFIASVLLVFLGYSHLKAEIIYSDYDNSLSFENITNADIHLIWLDYSQYHEDMCHNMAWLEWLGKRIDHLRHLTKSPILINDWFFLNSEENKGFNHTLQRLTEQFRDVYVCSQEPVFNVLGNRFFDLRMTKFAGTPLSDMACLYNARLFGLKWLPAVLKPRLKAVVVDLDNTLYSGVLGEDGNSGIILNDGYIALQNYLLQLRGEGIFLALCSRNEQTDVENLFNQRTDFILKLTHFSAVEISWQKKSCGIEKIAQKLKNWDGLHSVR